MTLDSGPRIAVRWRTKVLTFNTKPD